MHERTGNRNSAKSTKTASFSHFNLGTAWDDDEDDARSRARVPGCVSRRRPGLAGARAPVRRHVGVAGVAAVEALSLEESHSTDLPHGAGGAIDGRIGGRRRSLVGIAAQP